MSNSIISELEILKNKIERKIERNLFRIEKCKEIQNPTVHAHWDEGYLTAKDSVLNDVLGDIEDILENGKCRISARRPSGVSTLELEMAKTILEQRIELNELIAEKENLGDEYLDTRLTDVLTDIDGMLGKRKK